MLALILPPLQWFDNNGDPLSGGKIYIDDGGTTTPKPTYTDSTGGVANAYPIVLDAAGRPPGGIYGASGLFKITVKTSADVTLRTDDNVSLINDVTVSSAEWQSLGLAYTYIDGDTFTAPGDRTADFHVGRRLQITDGGGVKYASIASSSFGAGVTTVNVTLDTGSIAASLSNVNVALLRADHLSVPKVYATPTDVSTLAAAEALKHPLPPIGATVAANALTLTLDPLTMDFRSATLTSGAVNQRTVAAQISLVVPSGATLGTSNATAARLVVLALDNAGTVELAVVNASGNLALDESGVISSTTISAASASASTVYSTTGRASVPYRVIGYIDITEATAGTWASSPTVVQPVGGQVIVGGNSIGYGQTWQSVTRNSGTTYINATGKPIMVKADLTVNVGQAAQTAISINGSAMGLIVGGFQTTGGTQTFAGAMIIPAWASYVMTDSGPGFNARLTYELR